MSDFLQQFGESLAKQVTDTALRSLELRLTELAHKEYKPFYTFPEMAQLFGVSVSTIRRRAKSGALAYTRNFNGEKGCLKSHIEDYFRRLEVRAGAAPADSGDNVFSINNRLKSA